MYGYYDESWKDLDPEGPAESTTEAEDRYAEQRIDAWLGGFR
jgi:hypothetical protein